MSEPVMRSNSEASEPKDSSGSNGIGLTPEPRYAGFWIRVAASLIDTVLLLAMTAPLLMLFYGSDAFDPEVQPSGVAATLINYVLPAIAVIAFWIYKSATPGKMVLGLRIVDAETAGTPTKGQLIGRYFAYYVSMIPLMAGFVWVAFDKRKQGFHDKLAKTLVILDREELQAGRDERSEPDSNSDNSHIDTHTTGTPTDSAPESGMKHDKYRRRQVPSVERMRK